MAKGKYETHVLPNLEKIEWWLAQGATLDEIAQKLDVAPSTLDLYLSRGRSGEQPYSGFSGLYDKVRIELDDSVKAALYKKTQGYNAKVAKHVKVKCIEYDENTGKKIREYEELREVFDEVHVAADTNAQIFWLTRRLPREWPYKPVERDLDIDETGVVELGMPAAEPVPPPDVVERFEKQFLEDET